jgi:hypothetical protein
MSMQVAYVCILHISHNNFYLSMTFSQVEMKKVHSKFPHLCYAVLLDKHKVHTMLRSEILKNMEVAQSSKALVTN